MFIGRTEELSRLESEYSGEGFKFFLIYGNKGSGKTTLLEEFCRNKSAIFFTASNGSGRSNLNTFSRIILRHYGDEKHSPFQFWDNALRYIADCQRGSRLILVIDGLDILAERDPAFLGMFAREIQERLAVSNIFLAIACDDSSFLKGNAILRNITGTLKLPKFLTRENISRLMQEERRQSGEIKQSKFFRISADRVILKEGSMSNYVYKIVSGRAVCYINYGNENEYILGSLREGNTFGEYSLLTGKPCIYTVTAFTDMLLLRIGHEEFEKFIGINTGNAIEIMRNMASMMNVMKVNIDMLNKELNHQD